MKILTQRNEITNKMKKKINIDKIVNEAVRNSLNDISVFEDVSINETDLKNAIRESIVATLLDNRMSTKSLNEASINRILSHGKNGFIVISGSRDSIKAPYNKDIDLTHDYIDWLKMSGLKDSDDNESYWLSERNKQADESLQNDIMRSPFSFTKTFGGYHPKGVQNASSDSYEPSYIVYCHDRQGNVLDFDELYKFAIEMCNKYKQDSVYIQAPNEAPNYVNGKGEKINAKSSLKFKINKDDEEYYTTQNRKKNRPHRFTADIQFENMRVFNGPSSLNEGRRRRWYGEVFV